MKLEISCEDNEACEKRINSQVETPTTSRMTTRNVSSEPRKQQCKCGKMNNCWTCALCRNRICATCRSKKNPKYCKNCE